MKVIRLIELLTNQLSIIRNHCSLILTVKTLDELPELTNNTNNKKPS